MHAFKRTLALFVLVAIIPLAATAQIYSVPAGGVWSNVATWEGGVVPDANAHAIIRGIVSVSSNTTVGQITVEASAVLQNTSGVDPTLIVLNNLANFGTVQDVSSGWWLYVRVGGDVANNGSWTNRRTYLDGTGDQVLTHGPGTTFSSPLESLKDSGTIIASSDLDFSNMFDLNQDPLQMRSNTLSVRGLGYIIDGLIYTEGAIAQYTSSRSALEQNRIIGTATIRNRFNIGRDNYFEGTLVVADTLQNVIGCDCTTYVEGDVVNNGTIRDVVSGWWLYMRINGNLTNNGTWSNRNTYLIGTGDQTLTQGVGTTFLGPLDSQKDSGTIIAGGDLDFSNVFDLNQDPLQMGSNTLSVRGDGYILEGLIYTEGAIAQYESSRSALEQNRIVGTATLRNRFNIGRNNHFEGALVVADTLQNVIGCDCTTYVEGNVVNNGTIRDVVSGWWLYMQVLGNMTNNGTWSNRKTYLTGTGDQILTHGTGTTFSSPLESLKETGFIRAGSNLDFSSALDLNTDSLYTERYGITVRGIGQILESNIFMNAFLRQTMAATSAAESSRFVGTTRLRELVNMGRGVSFAGTVVVEDTLQNRMGCDCVTTVEGHLINQGTIRDVDPGWWLLLNLQGSITDLGVEWSNKANYLNGDGMRTWNVPRATAPFAMNGGNVLLVGDNRMSRFSVSAEKGPHIASGARFQVPADGADRMSNDGQVYLLEDVSAGGTYELYRSDFRVAAAAFDTLQVTHHGNQAPFSFSNAVRSFWTIRSVPDHSNSSIEWMNFGYDEGQMGKNVEAELHVFHSDDEGQTWRQVSSEGNLERHPESDYLRLNGLPSSGLFALSSNPEMITVLPSVITSVIGRDQIRLGPPNRYTIHYANNSDVPTGEMLMMINVNRNIHIDHIEPSAPEGVKSDWLYPKDFGIYGDSTAAPPDSVAVLILQSMAAHEERSFDIVLEAYPDAPGKGFIVLPAIGVVVWWAATGLATAYVTDVAFNVVEESYARTDGVRPVITEALRKTNQKWFSFEKPATELVKDLALTWGQGVVGGTFGTAAVVAVKLGEGLFNFLKAVACGGDRYVNGRQTMSACLDKPLEKVTSWDPNEKIGPTGYGPGGFVTDASRMTYQILFENKAEATAPAWKIAIDDTLSSLFNASSARFEGASHEGFDFSVDGQVLHWEITGIELAPNVTPPEGEGYVLFSVDTVPGISSGTPLENRAVIVFDYNPPIMTNTYVNTVDYRAPVTLMAPMPGEVSGGDLTVRWQAVDAVGEAGIQSTNLFMSVDGEAFQSMGSTFADSMVVSVDPYHEYQFYALSKDNVGNSETVRPQLSSVNVISAVAVEDGENPFIFALDPAYPNPFNPKTTIAYTIPTTGGVRLDVFDVVGRRIATLVQEDQVVGRHLISWDASDFASGIYFYQLIQGANRQTRPLVLLK